jgi:phosphoglycolate phosphatase
MMTEHRFRLIVFDVDGTLVDSQTGIVAAMTRTFEGLGLPAPDADTTRRIVGLSLDEAIGRLLPPDASPDLIARGAELYKEAFIAERRRPDYCEPLYPDVAEVLRALDTPEVCLGVATGKSRKGLDVTLARHGLAGHFVTLQTADHGPGKPHPRMLRTAMSDVGADPAETVLIGDTIFDMEMAGNAGTAALGVSWGYHDAADLSSSGARRVLERITDLPAALREIST